MDLKTHNTNQSHLKQTLVNTDLQDPPRAPPGWLSVERVGLMTWWL